MYQYLDDTNRRKIESKDAQIVAISSKIEEAKKRIEDLRNNKNVETVINKNKTNKRLTDKLFELLKIKNEFETIKEKRQVIKQQIEKFYDIDNFSTISQDLLERDICAVDSAMVSSTKLPGGSQESNIIFSNFTGSQLLLGNDPFKLIDFKKSQNP